MVVALFAGVAYDAGRGNRFGHVSRLIDAHLGTAGDDELDGPDRRRPLVTAVLCLRGPPWPSMITRQQFFRAVETIAVPVLLGLVARHLWGDKQEQTPPSLYLPLLADIGFAPRKLPVTYRIGIPEFDTYERVSVLSNATAEGTPDVTAVLLNWSRFPNVMLISSLLCAPWLNGTIAEVFIWNNNPRKLTYEVWMLLSPVHPLVQSTDKLGRRS